MCTPIGDVEGEIFTKELCKHVQIYDGYFCRARLLKVFCEAQCILAGVKTVGKSPVSSDKWKRSIRIIGLDFGA